MNSRRIDSLTEYPRLQVRRTLEGEMELVLVGGSLRVTVRLDETDVRGLVDQVWEAFEKIRDARNQANELNFNRLRRSAQ